MVQYADFCLISHNFHSARHHNFFCMWLHKTYQSVIFTESAHWADSVIESHCPSVRLCVCTTSVTSPLPARMILQKDLVFSSVAEFLGCWAVGGKANLSLNTLDGITTVSFTTSLLGHPEAPLHPPASSADPQQHPRRRHHGPAQRERDRQCSARHQAGSPLLLIPYKRGIHSFCDNPFPLHSSVNSYSTNFGWSWFLCSIS